MYIQDPYTSKVKEICKSLIGSKIKFNFTINLDNGKKFSGEISNCNIIGDCMETILYPFIVKEIPTFEEGPKQASPDFYNLNKEWEYELKCFNNKPGFDISNFNSYIYQINKDLEKKLYRTKYLIFKYKIDKNTIEIDDFKLCSVWEIINYTGKNPVSLQSKKGTWYNIRPCCFKDMNSNDKSPLIFIKNICSAILKTPNKMEDKEKIIDNINKQFYKIQFKEVLSEISNNY